MAPRKHTRTRKHKKLQQSKQSKTCPFCKKSLRQSGGNYQLATDITVDGIPMREDTVIISSDGSSMTAKEKKALEEI